MKQLCDFALELHPWKLPGWTNRLAHFADFLLPQRLKDDFWPDARRIAHRNRDARP